ncbi:MAG TPA: hypothetical protein VD902_16685, partial [Symbiobacteriaceae bacterium]|nr:hypothetical protein [Symbiobacteriaceae bacterium]
MRLRIGLLLLLCLLLPACSKAPPPAPVSQEDKPATAVVKRKFFRVAYRDTFLPGLHENLEVTGNETVGFGPQGLVLTWELNGRPADIKVASSGPQPESVNIEQTYVQARFYRVPPGPFQVWLEGFEGSRFYVEQRTEPPSLKIGYVDQDGKVVPVTANAALPPGPITLDFAFDQPMNPASLAKATLSMWGKEPVAGKAEWLAPDHARWNIPDLPYGLHLYTENFVGENGLPLQEGPTLTIRSTAGFPYLERIRSWDGKAERVADLPPDILEAELAPDASRLALQTQDDWQVVQVVDLKSRTTTRLDVRPQELRWAPNGDMLSFGTGPWAQDPGWARWSPATGKVERFEQGALYNAVLSPDGRQAAFLRWGPGGVDFDKAYPSDLVLYDLQTRQEQVLASAFSHYFYFGKEGDFRQWVAWSPDGKQMAALDPTARGVGADLVLFDLSTRQRTVLRKGLNVRAFGTRVAWSPDGSLIAAGSLVIPLGANNPVVQMHEWSDQGFWSPDSQQILSSEGWYGAVYVYDLALGKRAEFGSGRPV